MNRSVRTACSAVLVLVLAALSWGVLAPRPAAAVTIRPAAVGAWGGYQNGQIPLSALAVVPWQPGQYLRPDAESALAAMDVAYRAAFGHDLRVNSAYRSYQDQVAARTYWCNLGACGNAAVPGTSNHGWGLAVDIGETTGAAIGYTSPTYAWMKANGPRYGWVHPCWAEPGGQGPYEAWHFEYQGTSSGGGGCASTPPGTADGSDPSGLPCVQPVTGITAASGTVVVTVPDLNARTAPSTDCATGLVSVHQGQTFTRTGVYGSWTRVTVNGAVMWVASAYVSTQPGTPPPPTVASMDRAGYVLAADAGGTVWAYPVSSTGAFGTRVAVAYTVAGLRAAMPVGDLTAEGHNDLVTVDAAGTVRRYVGSGGTGFAAPTTLTVTWANMLSITSAGDATGDGIPDVYTLTSDHRLLLWRGNAYGGFTAPLTVAGNWSTADLISGGVDLNGDGIPDLIVRTAAGTLMLYPGDGHGGFGTPYQIGIGWGGMTAIFGSTDVADGGRPGVLARTASGQLVSYTNTGNGVLTGGIVIGAGWQGMTTLSGSAPTVTGPRTSVAGVDDLNGDLTADVTAVTSSGALAMYPGNGRGGWGTATTPLPGWADARIVRLGDFTGTGHADLGAIAAGGTFRLYPGDGTGAFGTPVTIGVGWGGMTAVLGGVDFDADGHRDVLARNAAGQLLLYRGNGAGGWAAGSGQVVGTGWGGFTALTVVHGFAGDGRDAVLARRADGTLWLYPLTGSGGWGTPVQVGQGWGGMTALVGTGDFDGDGHADVLARTAGGALMLYRGNGHGGWLGSTQVGSGWNGMQQIG